MEIILARVLIECEDLKLNEIHVRSGFSTHFISHSMLSLRPGTRHSPDKYSAMNRKLHGVFKKLALLRGSCCMYGPSCYGSLMGAAPGQTL